MIVARSRYNNARVRGAEEIGRLARGRIIKSDDQAFNHDWLDLPLSYPRSLEGDNPIRLDDTIPILPSGITLACKYLRTTEYSCVNLKLTRTE